VSRFVRSGAATISILRADTATPDAHPRIWAARLIIVGSEPERALIACPKPVVRDRQLRVSCRRSCRQLSGSGGTIMQSPTALRLSLELVPNRSELPLSLRWLPRSPD
jgi:hypothetical protein